MKTLILVAFCLITVAAGTQNWDCAGVMNGESVLDACNVCGGNNSTCADCKGIPNGPNKEDDCGVCNGDGSTCCYNYLDVDNKLWNYILLPTTIQDIISRLEKSWLVVSWLNDNIPEELELFDIIEDKYQVGDMVEINRMFLQLCLTPFCKDSTEFHVELEEAIMMETTA